MAAICYLLLAVMLLLLLYWHGKRGQDVFTRMGIPGPKPSAFFGNILVFVSKNRCFNFIKLRKTYGKIYGLFYGHQPFLIIHDLDLVKQVMVKDFANFTDRWMININPSPVDKGVFFLKGRDWRRLRKIISPTFSGNKLRKMCSSINQCAAVLTNHLLRKARKNETVNMKDLFGAFTMDCIALTAFGLNVHSQNNPDNPFVRHARKIFTQSFFSKPLIFLMFLSPWFNKFTVSAWPLDVVRFFVNAIRDAMEERRKQQGQSRVDFLQLLLDAEAERKEGGKAGASETSCQRLTTHEVIGQAFLFFIAGYETTATALNCLSHALATHPGIQDKLHAEIVQELGEVEPDYENVGHLTYMDQVICEALRMYPPVSMLNRLVTEPCELGGLKLDRGMAVGIPVYAIHHDPHLYPEPHVFNPNRFSPEARASRHAMAFFPFGQGPRMCLGMRLALTESKIALTRILRAVKLVPCPETPPTLQLDDHGILQLVTPNILGVEVR